MSSILATYYTVPGHYSQDVDNRRDNDRDAAVARAVARIRPLCGLNANSREFVDERVIEQKENGQSDYVARRWEVFADGSVVDSPSVESGGKGRA